MAMSWILIANASEAHLYAVPRAKLLNNHTLLNPIADYAHFQSREKLTDLVADKSGHNAHGTFVEASDPKMNEAKAFAKELTRRLEEGRQQNCFQDLIIVAPPKFHGILRHCIKPLSALRRTLSLDVEKDYTKLNENNLVNHLQGHI